MRKRHEQAASAVPQRTVKLRYLLDPGLSDGWLAGTLRRLKYRLVFHVLMRLRSPLWQLGYGFDFSDVFTGPNANAFAWNLIPYNASKQFQDSLTEAPDDARQIN